MYHHINNVKVGAKFSDCGKFRYSLTIEKTSGAGNKTLCVIMQNPSMAGAEIADKSVQFLEKLIFLKNYKVFSEVTRIVVVNQFAYIRTKHFRGSERHKGPDNDRYIKEAISSSDIILIAWGRINPFQERIKTVQEIIGAQPPKVLLQTRKHPSRGSYSNFIIPYSLPA